MTRRAQGLVLLLTALVAFRLVVSGRYDDYVRPGIRVPLLAASAFLAVLGLITAFAEAWRQDQAELDRHRGPKGPARDVGAHTGDEHEHRLLVGWLLTLPLAVLIAVAPAPLGADAASRQDAYSPQIERTAFTPVEAPTDGAVSLRLGEFVDRALWDAARSLEGTVVRLEGFVTHDPDVDGFVLTRFRISCCAADAVPVEVSILDPSADPPDDQWVAVTGVLVPPPDVDPEAPTFPRVELTAEAIEEIPEPDSPYE